ncbi:MAG TPA: PH domain-containing protein [Candidatus Microsaccharimonas sp.]|nr:PH domain-containing protein [Candidatus Microsaccharimonas sp.]
MEPNTQQPIQPNVANNPLHVMSPGEQIICNIKRHPIGLIGVYAMCGILLLVLFTVVGILPHFVTNLTTTDKMYAFVGAIGLAALILLFAWVAIIVYNGNRWIVTSDSITQIQQTGLFQKQTSQLSLENLEDVTFEQKSLIQSLFNFGTLKVETAGEHSKFQFPFCPSPQKCAVEIIQAHEKYMSDNINVNQQLNTNTSVQAEVAPNTPPQFPPQA